MICLMQAGSLFWVYQIVIGTLRSNTLTPHEGSSTSWFCFWRMAAARPLRSVDIFDMVAPTRRTGFCVGGVMVDAQRRRPLRVTLTP
jgi:hypothetical protein